MRFVKGPLTNHNTGKSVEAFLPIDINKENRVYRNGMMSVDIEGDERQLSSHVMRMLAAFNMTAEERVRLGQDCSVFALACETDSLFEDVSFGEKDMLVGCAQYDVADQGLELGMGDVGFSTEGLVNDSDFLRGVHFFIKASWSGEGAPIYASKVGTLGPTVLHNFDDLLEFYPQVTVGQAIGFSAVNHFDSMTFTYKVNHAAMPARFDLV